MKFKRPIRHAVTCILVTLVMGGCASMRSPAQSLAKGGEEVLLTTASSFERLSSQLDMHMDREVLRGALDQSVPPPTPAMRQAIERVQQAYRIRTRLLRDLSRFYSAFGALAAYDASADVIEATGDVTDSANSLATTLGLAQPFTGPADSIINSLAGGIATNSQNKRLRNANELALQLLPPVIQLLEDEQRVNASVLRTLADVEAKTAALLFNKNIGVADDLLISLMGESGVTYNAKSGRSAVNADPALKAALTEVLALRADRRQAASKRLAASMIGAVKKLDTEHHKFKAGKPLEMTAIAEHIVTIRTIVEQVMTTHQN